MDQNLTKYFKISLYLLALLNILTFLLVFNFSNLEGIQFGDNLVSVEIGINSPFWAYSFVISLMILLANVFYDLKSLSENRHYQDYLRVIILVIAGIILYGMAFAIPFHEKISINKANHQIITQRHFVLRGLSRQEIKYEEISYIKYTLQYYYMRNPNVKNYICLVSLLLNSGREIQVSASSQDIHSVSLREKLAQEIARATGKKIVVDRRQAY